MAHKAADLQAIRQIIFDLLRPEVAYVKVVLVYGAAISLLTVAVPVAVQTLINSVANTGAKQAIITMAIVLFITLLLSSALSALRTRVMEYFERHIYARLTAEISIRTLFARHDVFAGRKNVDLVQRYFDIMILQKNIPSLLVDGFAFLLQSLVGISLVSFYHPVLMGFNLLLILMVYLIWMFWQKGAKQSAIDLSHAKYNTAKWLTEIASAHEFFKSRHHVNFALSRTEKMTANYVKARGEHFHFTFSQTLMFLLLYAAASAGLLGLGGWLVTEGSLSIGQLVAAELVLSAIFFGLSQLSGYLKLYYDLYGAADELNQILSVPQESQDSGTQSVAKELSLSFHKVHLGYGEKELNISFYLPPRAKAYICTQEPWLQMEIIHLLKRNKLVKNGSIRLGRYELEDYSLLDFRQTISVIDLSPIINCSVRDFIRLSAPKASLTEIHDTLEKVGLSRLIDHLPKGLDTELSSLGRPLERSQFLLLKLGVALLGGASVIVLTPQFDTLPEDVLQKLLIQLKKESCLLLYFSNEPNRPEMDLCLPLDYFEVEDEYGVKQ